MADMWRDLYRWEKDNYAVVFMVVNTEEVREALAYYNAFEKDCEEYICDINDVSEKVVHEALLDAYNTLNFDYGLSYEDINESCYDYIVEELNTNEYKQMELELQGETNAS